MSIYRPTYIETAWRASAHGELYKNERQASNLKCVRLYERCGFVHGCGLSF